jgi:sulfite exporter TauE/SafE
LDNLTTLTITAASLAFVHTLFGPDHYLPFIVMARARKWTLYKTTWVTLLSGFGHVMSSVLLGAVGIAVGAGLNRLELFESFRGDLAAWLFVIFGFVYMAWGIYRGVRNKPHKHFHHHANGTVHVHEHIHSNDHDHVHKNNITPWILFTIFFLGPCEPLIPLLMYPASQSSTWGIIQVSAVFSIVTMGTMLALVLVASYGLKMVRFGKVERYMHAIAGATIFLSGIGILFLGL